MPDTHDTRTPIVRKQAYTFSVTSHCIYCGKAATRTLTYAARSEVDATAQANATVEAGIWHRKCGLS